MTVHVKVRAVKGVPRHLLLAMPSSLAHGKGVVNNRASIEVSMR
jgi:hypothetical protein